MYQQKGQKFVELEQVERESVQEGYSTKEIKMAIGIASDKRYAGGNMSGAVAAIEKIKKGLSDHKQVAAVLKRQNEDVQIDEMTAAEKKLIDLMYDKKGNLTPLGKKVMDHGKGKKEGVEPVQWPSQPLPEEMDPTDHVKKKDDKFCVYNADGSIAKEFDNKEDADKYAIDNHDKLMATKKEVSENKSLIKDYEKYMSQSGKKSHNAFDYLMSMPKYKRMSKDQMTKIIGDAKRKGIFKEEGELDEKYDLYHKDFSGAMQHAYDYAKKKLGITVDPKEIDSKVATGPKKPSEGKTNKYRLKGKGGNLQIQVYNKGGSKPFELNMYKEEVELDENKKADLAKKLAKASQSSKKGKSKVTLKKAPWDKKEEADKPKIDNRPDSAKDVDAARDDKKKTRIAQLQLQIAKATETINKINSQEK
jgi:hypothetical protein